MSKINMTRGSAPARLGGGKIVALALITAALAGCKHDEGPQVAGWALVDPNQRHPIMVSQQPSNLALTIPRGSQGLSPSQRADVLNFTSRYRASDGGNSRLVLSAPSGSGNEVAAMNAVEEVRGILIDGGFAESAIAVEAYHDESRKDPPLRISYMRYVAEGPECGYDWSENLAYNPKNTNYKDFGCSNQHNLAAMVANPADLLGPRTEGPRYSERRDDAFGKYAKGKATAAEKTDDERVRVKDQ